MITESQYKINGKYMGAVNFYGLSTDSKPTTTGNGSKFTEIDTGKIYIFDSANETWYCDGEAAAAKKSRKRTK